MPGDPRAAVPGGLWRRSSGILAHPTSLPGPHGCGDLGPSAHCFLDFLGKARQRWWQMLPLGPAGYGDSPYSAESSFAGSPLLVALEPLMAAGLLPRAPMPGIAVARARVDFARVAAARDRCLREAFQAFEALPVAEREGLDSFRRKSADWLDDFCLFRALKRHHDGAPWTAWPAPVRDRAPRALKALRHELRAEVAYEAFVQYQFAEQCSKLRSEANARGIALMGDIPLYVAHDSADVWQNRRLFRLDDDGMPTKVAGVPPDYFSATGQRWGNPLYAWKRHATAEFTWWVKRLRHALARFDAVRLDHFIGFRRYWEIDASCPTAEQGRWRRGPGSRLFAALARGLRPRGGRLPLVAEDLGVVGPDVLLLRDRWKLPGMKVLQFAFGADPSAESFAPHNYRERSIVYTGTHDNDTTVGWYRHSATDAEREACERYLGGASDGESIQWRFVRAASASVAAISMFPLQDILGLDSDARMNRPGTVDGNWSWRVDGSALTDAVAARLGELTQTYGRATEAPPP